MIDTDHSVIVDVEGTRSIRQAEVGSVRTMLDRIKELHDIDPNRKPTGTGVAKYQALKHTCLVCPSKMKCCPKADARKITREEHEDVRQVARDIAKTKQYAISMRLRKKVEMLFAHLKRILGLGRLRLRGPSLGIMAVP